MLSLLLEAHHTPHAPPSTISPRIRATCVPLLLYKHSQCLFLHANLPPSSPPTFSTSHLKALTTLSMDPKPLAALAFILLFHLWSSTCAVAQQCGSAVGGQVCANNLCCSKYGYCGSTSDYCGDGCQSQCGGSGGGSVASIITSAVFDQFLDHRNDGGCPANGFYTYDAFLNAAGAFAGFGTTGDADAQKRELAAFFAHASHETTGGCYKEEINKQTYCQVTSQWSCASGKQYYGRGPLQITWNYNYGPAGQAIGFDGINNPDIVASDAPTSFKTAVWYWMTQQSPTCHTIMVNNQGFGATTNAINGGIECNQGSISSQQQDRINHYQSFCQILGVQPGDNLSC